MSASEVTVDIYTTIRLGLSECFPGQTVQKCLFIPDMELRSDQSNNTIEIQVK